MSNKLQSKSEDLLYHNQCRNENKISKVSTFMSQFVSFWLINNNYVNTCKQASCCFCFKHHTGVLV